jgi:hypothetical protein
MLSNNSLNHRLMERTRVDVEKFAETMKKLGDEKDSP